MLKKVATSGGVLAIALVGFFSARAITDAVDGERSSPAPKRPKVYGIAAAPAPEPPDWPAEKKAAPTGGSQTGESGGGGTPIVETPVQKPETTYPSEVHETPPPDPKPPPSDSGGSKQEGGPSGSGIEEEVGG